MPTARSEENFNHAHELLLSAIGVAEDHEVYGACGTGLRPLFWHGKHSRKSIATARSGLRKNPAENVSAKLQSLSFDGQFLERGFWLYVWEVIPADGHSVFYVGMTGDSSSANAQSPFSRLSQHLGSNRHANALRRQLVKAGIEPTACRSFEMVAYGPIFPHADSQDEHKASWRLVSAMEKALRDALDATGYPVLNDVRCRQLLHKDHWQKVLKAFSGRFEKLSDVPDYLGDA